MNTIFRLYEKTFWRLGEELENTPLKYLGSGYWLERYGRKSLKEIERFEELAEKRKRPCSEPREAFSEAENKVKWNGRKSVVIWAALFSSFAIKGLEYMMSNQETFPLMIPYVLILHEFACPSSFRKYIELMENGEYELASIVGTKAEPFGCNRYFRERFGFVSADKLHESGTDEPKDDFYDI